MDVYKTEFCKNANITLYSNILYGKNLFFLGKGKSDIKDFFKNNLVKTNIMGITNFFYKNELLKVVEKPLFKKKFLFFSGFESKILKQNFLKKSQAILIQKKQNSLFKNLNNLIYSWDNADVVGFTNFFEKEILNNYNCVKTTIQHPDLDDEPLFLKKNIGKNTPIRVLKYPNNELFMKDSLSQTNDIELLRLRFNEQKSTLVNRPIRLTTYLTFKQKRYNQRTSIGKKTQAYFNKDLGKNQNYSGNPFLKDLSIIEENFGNPTRQYKLVKKSKSRLDTTRVAS